MQDRETVERDINKVVRAHTFHSTAPMQDDRPCNLCRFTWKKLARIAMFGNPGKRLHIK